MGIVGPRANSSAGSERLPYTQDVGGSNPSSPISHPRLSAAVVGPAGSLLRGGHCMYLFRLVTLVALSGALTVPLAAQGIPRNAQRTSVTMAPRFMVANPFAFAPGDSAPAVAIGSGVREEMKGVVGRDFQVVEQQQMNDALTQYGYPKDAILSPALASTLAKNIQARYIVTSTLAKGQGGGYTVTARIQGVNDDAGNVVTLAQQQGESPQAYGKRVAEALEPMVETADEAKACIDQRTAKPDKAAEAAQKAIKAVPNHGLAHY